MSSHQKLPFYKIKIIRFRLSLLVWSKVIPLSGFYWNVMSYLPFLSFDINKKFPSVWIMHYHFSTGKKSETYLFQTIFFGTTALTIQRHFLLLFTTLSLMQRFVFGLETKHKTNLLIFFEWVKNGFLQKKTTFLVFLVMFWICSLLQQIKSPI